MNPDKQQIAIAEACGWTLFPSRIDHIDRIAYPMPARWQHPSLEGKPPDYLSDFNAMHEAEKTLNAKQRNLYVILLLKGGEGKGETLGCWHCLHATATQRAEAFLRAIGKWEE